MLEGIVNDGLQYQSITNVRRAAEMEHVYGPQGRVSVTQAAKTKHEEKGVCSLLRIFIMRRRVRTATHKTNFVLGITMNMLICFLAKSLEKIDTSLISPC